MKNTDIIPPTPIARCVSLTESTALTGNYPETQPNVCELWLTSHSETIT